MCSWGQTPLALRLPSEPIQGKLYSIRDYLDQHYKEKLLLDDLAAAFYINKYHLSRGYKRILGITFVDYLTAKRITYAKELLRFTSHSLEVVAVACGYPDASYFNKVFKKTESLTGSEYRKKWKG